MNCSGFSTVFVVSGGIRIQAQPGGPASGDLTGSYDGVLGPIVHRIQSQSVDPRVPNNGDTFVFNGGEWIPTPTPTNTATVFRGTWDANANTPDISISPSDGDSWIVSVAGNTNLGGITGWIVGDYAVYSNGNWYKLSNQSFGWTLTGNNGTNSNINFIGTADEHDLSIRANSLEGFRIFTDGNSRAARSLNVVENLTASNAHFSGDVKINGGDVTTSATSFNLLNSVATTINFGSAASTCLKMGNSAGHTIISGSVKIPNGLSGSLTRLTDGSSYLREGLGTLIESGTDGHVTIGVKDSVFATISGSTFTGPVLFNAGLSGSLTTLVNGTPYLKSGVNVVISTASNGSITVATPAAGTDTQIQFNDGGTLFGATAGFTFDKSTSNVLIGGDLAVNGGDITTTAPTFNIAQASNLINIGSSAGHVDIAGDLKVSGNDIKSSTGATAIQLTGSDVAISGNLVSSGSLDVVGNVTGSNAKFSGTVSVSSLDSTGVVIANSGGKLITTGALTYKNNGLFVSSSLYVTNSVSASHFVTTDGGSVKFVEQGGPHYTSFRAAQQTVDIEYSLPQTEGLDKEFLMSDGAGNLDWVDTRTLNWSLTGNGSTNPNTNFIGTTDANPLILKTNSVEKLRLGSSNGSSLTGSLIIKNGNLNVSQKLILSGVLTPPILSTNQNDYSPAGIDEATTLRVSSSTSVNITGLADGNESGRIVFITNIGANLITLISESSLSTAKNRFILPNPTLILSEGDSILLQYDEISQRWRAPATSKGTYAGNQKFRFFQATAVAGTTFGNYATVAVTGNSSTNINFQVPEDSIIVEEVQVLGFPTSSQTNKSITYTGSAIQIGAAFNSRNATATITTNLIANSLQAFNALAAFQTLRAGDFCGLRIDHNNIGTTIDYIGVYITYR